MDRRAPGSGVSWGPPVFEEELADREGDRERGADVLRPRLDRHVGRSGLGGVVQGHDPAAPPPSTIAIGAPRVTPAFSAMASARARASSNAASTASAYWLSASDTVSVGPETWFAPAATAASTVGPARSRSRTVARTVLEAS